MPPRLLLVLAAAVFPFALTAQDAAPPPPPPLRVFLDCQSLWCDFSHLRREITFVDWVRDRADAEVFILGTSRGTGAGGREVVLTFLGRGRFVGRNDTTRFTTAGTDTDAEERDALTRALAVGLVPFVARTPAGRRLRVQFDRPSGAARDVEPERDPWNYWVFRIEGSGSLSGQERERSYFGRGEVGARRVTEGWKLDLEVNGSYGRDEYVIDTTEIYTRSSWSAEVLSVWSVGPHFSIGAISEAQHSTFRNYELAVEGGPGIEYSVYPYEESSRREITFRYLIGAAHYRYQDTTIFGRVEETRPLHDLNIRANFRQPWGNLEGGVSGSQYLHDLAKHRIELFGGIEIRIIRGLGFQVNGFVARVKDQINLAAGDLTPAEILVSQRQLGTNYEFHTSIGLSYTFGSLFNNVVNPRF